MPAFLLLEQELGHIDKMIHRLAELAATERMERSTVVVNAEYWRRRIGDLLDRANNEVALVERASALLRAVDELPKVSTRPRCRDSTNRP